MAIKNPYRPGDAFQTIVESLGITPKEEKGCGCKRLQGRMNKLGIDGCRENRDKLIAEMREKTSHYTMAEKLKAASYAVISGLALRLNPLDPIPGLFDESMKLAEENLAKRRSK